MIKLSVIIVSYNTKKTTYKSVHSLIRSLSQVNFFWEIIIIDNNSTDGSVVMLEQIAKKNPNIRIVKNKKNLGYSKANNQGLRLSKGEYILFLNSDVIIKKLDFEEILNFLDKEKKIGGLTVKLLLNNGKLDWACHRGFPTLWNSFCYFLKLEKIFKELPLINKIFGGYHLVDKNLKEIHEIDSPSGAFFLTRKKIVEELGGFDKKFFMYGEDLDLSYRIKKTGFKIIFYPKYSVLHLKYASGLEKKDKRIQKKAKQYFIQAMKIFYQKHYGKKYPNFINQIVYLIIDWQLRRLER